MAEEQNVNIPSALSAATQLESVDDFAFELPAELLDVSFALPDEPQPRPAEDPEPTPEQKKPRKKKSKNRAAKPVLRSSRGRELKTTVLYSSSKLKADEKPWTVPERKRLLAALKAHGSSDVNKLAKAVRTRSVAAVSHFLLERRRLKDRIVIQGPAGNRAAYATRILRRALNVIRRRYDRSKLLPQVVAACEQQPFPEPSEDSTKELPQFEHIYQTIRDKMENNVPAALGECELWIMHRLLWTIWNIVNTLDLDSSKEALYQALRWAAAQPADGYSKPTGQDDEQCQVLPSEDTMRRNMNFPSMKERKDGLQSSWNPLRMPTNVIQAQWAAIQEYLAQKPSHRECVESLLPNEEIPSTSSATTASNTIAGKAVAARKKTDSRSLEAFNVWKN